MRLTRVAPDDVPTLWELALAWLRPAIATDPTRTPDGVLAELCAGELTLWLVRGAEGHGYAVTSMGEVNDTGRLGFWVLFVGGHVSGGPKRRLALYRFLALEFEAWAQAFGCAEVWVEARDSWRHALPDYEVVRVLPERTEFMKRVS